MPFLERYGCRRHRHHWPMYCPFAAERPVFNPIAIGGETGRVPPPIGVSGVKSDAWAEHQRRTGDQFWRQPDALAVHLPVDVPAEILDVQARLVISM